jgi:hypothetical protein
LCKIVAYTARHQELPKLRARQPSVGDAAVPSLERKLSEDVISASAEVNREVSPVNIEPPP